MTKFLLQTIPRGIEEITTVLGLLGILLFLLFGHAKARVKWTIVFLLLFIVFWRTIFSRFQGMSSRYVSGLIIPFLLLAVYSFHQLIQKKAKAVRWCIAIMMAVMLLNYIKKDFKRNQGDINYYTIAEITKRSEAAGKEEVFLVPQKDLERISFLSQTDNVRIVQSFQFPYRQNFEKTYYPAIIDVDFDNSIIPNERKNHICSFRTSRNSKKRIDIFYSEPAIQLRVNPVPATIDAAENVLQNGTIEEIDSAQESQKKLVASIPKYSSFPEYDESVRTPQNAYFQVSPKTETMPSFGIESANPIDGRNSVFIRSGDGAVYLIFDQPLRNGRYSYSFLVKGKQGTTVQPVYKPHFDRNRHTIPICLFTIPDSRTFQISCTFDFDGLKDTDYFLVGVRVQDGETLLDDFVLSRKDLN